MPKAGSKAAPKTDTFWTLIYNHRHGTEVSLYQTYDGARLSACTTIIHWAEEVEREKGREVLQLIADGKFSEAMKMWPEISNESFEIVSSVPCSPQAAECIKSFARTRAKNLGLKLRFSRGRPVKIKG